MEFRGTGLVNQAVTAKNKLNKRHLLSPMNQKLERIINILLEVNNNMIISYSSIFNVLMVNIVHHQYI